MAELVDAADSKSVFERSGSSILPRGTIFTFKIKHLAFLKDWFLEVLFWKYFHVQEPLKPSFAGFFIA